MAARELVIKRTEGVNNVDFDLVEKRTNSSCKVKYWALYLNLAYISAVYAFLFFLVRLLPCLSPEQ